MFSPVNLYRLGATATFLSIFMALRQSAHGDATTASTASHALLALAAMFKMPYLANKSTAFHVVAATMVGWVVVTLTGQVQRRRRSVGKGYDEPFTQG
tara:strand:+ start:1204 stop:1497 length:294 start_codon:yes stop_codon:yes gene_type:complete